MPSGSSRLSSLLPTIFLSLSLAFHFAIEQWPSFFSCFHQRRIYSFSSTKLAKLLNFIIQSRIILTILRYIYIYIFFFFYLTRICRRWVWTCGRAVMILEFENDELFNMCKKYCRKRGISSEVARLIFVNVSLDNNSWSCGSKIWERALTDT